MGLTFPRLPLLALAAALGLAACAAPQPGLVRVGRAEVQLPDDPRWTPLGEQASDTVTVLPGDTAHPLPMQARALGLRNARGDLLAVLRVQTNATNHPRDATLWTLACPPQKGVQVDDFAEGSPVRIDCLRYKRFVDGADYLAASNPDLAQWLDANKAWPVRPYAHVSYRYSTVEGGYVAVDVLADQRLLRPETHDSEAFLRAGRPVQAWMLQLRQAVQQSAAMLDGRFVVPPFPQGVPESAPEPEPRTE